MSTKNKIRIALLPLLSIIVPVFNTEKYLKQCIESLLAQNLSDIELILVDDGSLDRSGDMCDEFARVDSRVKVIHKTNQGLAKARIDGIGVSTSNYIGFVDSDDFVSPDYFSRLYDCASRYDADMVCSSFSLFDDDSQNNSFRIEEIGFSGLYHNGNLKSGFYPHLLFDYGAGSSRKYFGYAWEKIYKTELIKEAISVAPNDIAIYEDIPVAFYCGLRASRIFFAREVNGYYYRQRSDSLVHSFKSNYYDDVLTLLDFLKKISVQLNAPASVTNNLEPYSANRLLLAMEALPYTDASWKKIKEMITELSNSRCNASEKTLKILAKNAHTLPRRVGVWALSKQNLPLLLCLALLRRIHGLFRRWSSNL